MDGMKQILLMIALVACLSAAGAVRIAFNEETKADYGPEFAKIIRSAIRAEIKKPTGELTEGDLAKVTSLNLNNTMMMDKGLKEIPELKKLGNLRLFGTQITDAGLKELVKRQQLTALDLGSTHITDAGLKEFPKLKMLRSLNLNDTKVTRMGVARLQELFPNCKIHSNPKK